MRIGIIGLGLIGGTIAKTLNNKHQVSAFDINQEALEYALQEKIIHEAYNDIKSFIKSNDVFYLCLYPKSLINFIFENKDYFPNNSIIIEISGVKKYIINEVSNLKLDNIDVIFTHPIAGSEKIGVFNSRANIFSQANYVITPVANNKPQNIELAQNLAKQMGFLNISLITPEEHDDIIAYTSQLTHVISLSLVNSISTTLDTKRFIGDSYRDLTRISMINEKLWPDLFITNKNALLNKIDAFEKELGKFKTAIKMNDNNTLESLMKNSTKIRKNIDRGKKNEG